MTNLDIAVPCMRKTNYQNSKLQNESKRNNSTYFEYNTTFLSLIFLTLFNVLISKAGTGVS